MSSAWIWFWVWTHDKFFFFLEPPPSILFRIEFQSGLSSRSCADAVRIDTGEGVRQSAQRSAWGFKFACLPLLHGQVCVGSQIFLFRDDLLSLRLASNFHTHRASGWAWLDRCPLARWSSYFVVHWRTNFDACSPSPRRSKLIRSG